MNFWLFELMLHLSHVQQMYSLPTHLTHESKLCIQITRGREDFNGDASVKSLHIFLLSLLSSAKLCPSSVNVLVHSISCNSWPNIFISGRKSSLASSSASPVTSAPESLRSSRPSWARWESLLTLGANFRSYQIQTWPFQASFWICYPFRCTVLCCNWYADNVKTL